MLLFTFSETWNSPKKMSLSIESSDDVILISLQECIYTKCYWWVCCSAMA